MATPLRRPLHRPQCRILHRRRSGSLKPPKRNDAAQVFILLRALRRRWTGWHPRIALRSERIAADLRRRANCRCTARAGGSRSRRFWRRRSLTPLHQEERRRLRRLRWQPRPLAPRPKEKKLLHPPQEATAPLRSRALLRKRITKVRNRRQRWPRRRVPRRVDDGWCCSDSRRPPWPLAPSPTLRTTTPPPTR